MSWEFFHSHGMENSCLVKKRPPTWLDRKCRPQLCWNKNVTQDAKMCFYRKLTAVAVAVSIVQGDRCSTRRATGVGSCEVDGGKHLVSLFLACGIL